MMTTVTTTSAFARRTARETSVWYQGHLFTFLAEAEDTAGQFSLLDAIIRQGFEPPPHTHSLEDESYYLLEGEIDFLIGDQNVPAKPGDFVYLPRHVLHGFTLRTPQARAVILITPAGLERGFRALSEPAATLTLPPIPVGPPPVAQLLKIFGDLGVVFAPPPANA